jgi:N-methylhydantoinase A/oxoprolinase/acetone carboxylase beta subunit
VTGIGLVGGDQDRTPLGRAAPAQARLQAKAHRSAYFEEFGGFVETPVYSDTDLVGGVAVVGQALVDAHTTTIVVPPGQDLHSLGPKGFLLLRSDADGQRDGAGPVVNLNRRG